MVDRRSFLQGTTHLCVAAMAGSLLSGETAAMTLDQDRQRFLLMGLAGSENPTRANFPFVWAVALHEAGHDVRIELAGDATVLMRTQVANNVTAVGWPPLSQALSKVIEYKIPIYI